MVIEALEDSRDFGVSRPGRFQSDARTGRLHTEVAVSEAQQTMALAYDSLEQLEVSLGPGIEGPGCPARGNSLGSGDALFLAHPGRGANDRRSRRPPSQPGDHAMPTQRTVLLVGGTGRTGRRVLEQLLSRGLSVRV